MTVFYIIGYLSLFLSIIAAYVAAKKNKVIPLVIGFILLVIAYIILWALEQQ